MVISVINAENVVVYLQIHRHEVVQEKIKAFQLYSKGMGYRAIGRFLGVSHVAVQKWVDQLTLELCPDPTAENTKHPVVEIDEMWHFVQKKTS